MLEAPLGFDCGGGLRSGIAKRPVFPQEKGFPLLYPSKPYEPCETSTLKTHDLLSLTKPPRPE